MAANLAFATSIHTVACFMWCLTCFHFEPSSKPSLRVVPVIPAAFFQTQPYFDILSNREVRMAHAVSVSHFRRWAPKLSPIGRGYSWMGDHLGTAPCWFSNLELMWVELLQLVSPVIRGQTWVVFLQTQNNSCNYYYFHNNENWEFVMETRHSLTLLWFLKCLWSEKFWFHIFKQHWSLSSK